MSKQEKLLNVFPEEVFFKDVIESQAYLEQIKLFNYSNRPMSVVRINLKYDLNPKDIYSSNPKVLGVVPNKLFLEPNQSRVIELKLFADEYFLKCQYLISSLNSLKKLYFLTIKSGEFEDEVYVHIHKKNEPGQSRTNHFNSLIELATFQISGELEQTFRQDSAYEKKISEVQQENFILAQRIEELEEKLSKTRPRYLSIAYPTTIRYEGQLRREDDYLLEELAEKNKTIQKLQTRIDIELADKSKLEKEVIFLWLSFE
jgi:hypothetical protein